MASERFSREQKEANLESLNELERRVLYRVLSGMKMSDVGLSLHMGVSTTRKVLTGVYEKFGIEESATVKKRQVLVAEYGYLTKRFKKEEYFVNWVGPKQEPTKTPPSENEVISEYEPPPSVKDIIERPPGAEPAPPPSPVLTLPPRNVLIIIGAGVILIILGIIIFGNNRPEPTPPDEAQVAEISVPISDTSTASLPPSITPTPTKKPKPTNTKIPTKTLPPPITPTPYQLPFVDEFDTGIRPEWKISGDIPNVVDKSLTVIGTTTLSLGLGETSLRDYIVDFKAERWSGVDNYIGIRALNQNNMIAIKNDDDMFPEYYVFIVTNGIWTKLPETRMIGCMNENIHFVINLKGNNLLVTYEDACAFKTIDLFLSEPYRKNGGVLIKVNNTSNPYNAAVVEYIRILPNP